VDTKIFEFIRLIDYALEIAVQIRGNNQTENLNNLIAALRTIRSQAIAGHLEPSQGVSTLGLSREVADWIDSLDSTLLKAVGAIDQYYQRYCDQ
jgi:hypothetical protein